MQSADYGSVAPLMTVARDPEPKTRNTSAICNLRSALCILVLPYSFLADTVLVVHGLFILFVILGGFFVLRWPILSWIHVPCAIWGALIEFQGWICPLTPLENHLRGLAGEPGYRGGFIEHYLLPLIYPPGLTSGVQVLLGGVVVAINLVAYLLVWRRHWRRQSPS